MKSNTKSALVTGGLVVGGLALVYAARNSMASSKDGQGSAGGQDAQNDQYAVDSGYQVVPDSTYVPPRPDQTYQLTTPDNFTPQAPPTNYTGDPNAPVAPAQSYAPGSVKPDFSGLYTPASPSDAPIGSAQGAFGALASSAGLIVGGVAANVGILKTAEAIASRTATELPEGRVAQALVDPYGVRAGSAAAKTAEGEAVPAIRVVGENAVKQGEEVAARTAAGKAAVKVGEASFGKKAASFIAGYIPILGIPVGAAIDVYSTSDAKDEKDRIGWGDALAANALGDVAQVGTIVAVPGAGLVAQGLTGFATADAYYAARDKPSLTGMALSAAFGSGANAAPSIGGNSAASLISNASGVSSFALASNQYGVPSVVAAASSSVASAAKNDTVQTFKVDLNQAAVANQQAASAGIASFNPVSSSSSSASMSSPAPNFSSASGGSTYVAAPASSSLATTPVASQSAAINYTPVNANFSSVSGQSVYVAPPVSSNVSSAVSTGTGKTSSAPVSTTSSSSSNSAAYASFKAGTGLNTSGSSAPRGITLNSSKKK